MPRHVLPMLPAGVLYAMLFAFPMLCLIGLSFWRSKGFELIPDLTFANYAKALGAPLYHVLFLRTVGVGLVTAWIVVPIAFALAYVMRFVFARRGQIILQLVLLSLFSGYLVRIYAWRTILGKQGLLNSTLLWSGLIDQPIEILIYSNIAVVITLTGLLLPLAVLPIYSAMQNIPASTLEAARDLGAGTGHLVRTVLLPLAMPGVRTAFAFAFLLAAGDFVTPTLVGGSQSILIGNVVADQFRGIGSNWPLGAALALVAMVLVLTIHLVAMRLVTAIAR